MRAGVALVVEVGETVTIGHVGHAFADVPPGELLAYIDARGALAIAINGGSAADVLAAGLDTELSLRPV
jgi:hypothetical protein